MSSGFPERDSKFEEYMKLRDKYSKPNDTDTNESPPLHTTCPRKYRFTK